MLLEQHLGGGHFLGWLAGAAAAFSICSTISACRG